MPRRFLAVSLALAAALPSGAATALPIRSGSAPGLNLALLAGEGTLDYVLGPVTLGLGGEFMRMNPDYPQETPAYKPLASAFLIWDFLQQEGLSIGLLASYQPLRYRNPAYQGTTSEPYYLAVYSADVGLAMTMSRVFTAPWGGDHRVSWSPNVTVMQDGKGNWLEGPASRWEIAVELLPGIETMVGGFSLTTLNLYGVRTHF